MMGRLPLILVVIYALSNVSFGINTKRPSVWERIEHRSTLSSHTHAGAEHRRDSGETLGDASSVWEGIKSQLSSTEQDLRFVSGREQQSGALRHSRSQGSRIGAQNGTQEQQVMHPAADNTTQGAVSSPALGSFDGAGDGNATVGNATDASSIHGTKTAEDEIEVDDPQDQSCLFCNATTGSWWISMLRPSTGLEHLSNETLLLGGESTPLHELERLEQEALDQAKQLPRAASDLVMGVMDRLKPSPEETARAKSALERVAATFESAQRQAKDAREDAQEAMEGQAQHERDDALAALKSARAQLQEELSARKQQAQEEQKVLKQRASAEVAEARANADKVAREARREARKELREKEQVLRKQRELLLAPVRAAQKAVGGVRTLEEEYLGKFAGRVAAVRLLLEGLKRADGDMHKEATEVEGALNKLLQIVQAHPPVSLDGVSEGAGAAVSALKKAAGDAHGSEEAGKAAGGSTNGTSDGGAAAASGNGTLGAASGDGAGGEGEGGVSLPDDEAPVVYGVHEAELAEKRFSQGAAMSGAAVASTAADLADAVRQAAGAVPDSGAEDALRQALGDVPAAVQGPSIEDGADAQDGAVVGNEDGAAAQDGAAAGNEDGEGGEVGEASEPQEGEGEDEEAEDEEEGVESKGDGNEQEDKSKDGDAKEIKDEGEEGTKDVKPAEGGDADEEPEEEQSEDDEEEQEEEEAGQEAQRFASRRRMGTGTGSLGKAASSRPRASAGTGRRSAAAASVSHSTLRAHGSSSAMESRALRAHRRLGHGIKQQVLQAAEPGHHGSHTHSHSQVHSARARRHLHGHSGHLHGRAHMHGRGMSLLQASSHSLPYASSDLSSPVSLLTPEEQDLLARQQANGQAQHAASEQADSPFGAGLSAAGTARFRSTGAGRAWQSEPSVGSSLGTDGLLTAGERALMQQDPSWTPAGMGMALGGAARLDAGAGAGARFRSRRAMGRENPAGGKAGGSPVMSVTGLREPQPPLGPLDPTGPLPVGGDGPTAHLQPGAVPDPVGNAAKHFNGLSYGEEGVPEMGEGELYGDEPYGDEQHGDHPFGQQPYGEDLPYEEDHYSSTASYAPGVHPQHTSGPGVPAAMHEHGHGHEHEQYPMPTSAPLPENQDSTAPAGSLVEPMSPHAVPDSLKDLPIPGPPPSPPRLADLLPPGMSAAGLRDLTRGGEAAVKAAHDVADQVSTEAAEMKRELLGAAGGVELPHPAGGGGEGSSLARQAARAAGAFATQGASSGAGDELLHGAQSQVIGGMTGADKPGNEGAPGNGTAGSGAKEGTDEGPVPVPGAAGNGNGTAGSPPAPGTPPAPAPVSIATPEEAAAVVNNIRKSAELALTGADGEIQAVRQRLEAVKQRRKEVAEALAGRTEADRLADEAREVADRQEAELARIDKAMELNWAQCSDGRFEADPIDCLEGQTLPAGKSAAVKQQRAGQQQAARDARRRAQAREAESKRRHAASAALRQAGLRLDQEEARLSSVLATSAKHLGRLRDRAKALRTVPSVLSLLHDEQQRVSKAEQQLDSKLKGVIRDAKEAKEASQTRLAPLLQAVEEQEDSTKEDLADIEQELAAARGAANRTVTIAQQAANAALRAAQAESSKALARDSREAKEASTAAVRDIEHRTQLARQVEKLREGIVDALDEAQRASFELDEAHEVSAAAEEWGASARKIGVAAEMQMSPDRGLLRDAMDIAMQTLNETAHAVLWLQARVDSAATVLNVTQERVEVLERLRLRVSHLAAVYLDHSIHQVRSAVHRLGSPLAEGEGLHGQSAPIVRPGLETSLARESSMGPTVAASKHAEDEELARQKREGPGAVLAKLLGVLKSARAKTHGGSQQQHASPPPAADLAFLQAGAGGGAGMDPVSEVEAALEAAHGAYGAVSPTPLASELYGRESLLGEASAGSTLSAGVASSAEQIDPMAQVGEPPRFRSVRQEQDQEEKDEPTGDESESGKDEHEAEAEPGEDEGEDGNVQAVEDEGEDGDVQAGPEEGEGEGEGEAPAPPASQVPLGETQTESLAKQGMLGVMQSGPVPLSDVEDPVSGEGSPEGTGSAGDNATADGALEAATAPAPAPKARTEADELVEEAVIADKCRGQGDHCTAVALHVNASATSVETYTKLMHRLRAIDAALRKGREQAAEAARDVTSRRLERSARAKEAICSASEAMAEAAAHQGTAREAVEASRAAVLPAQRARQQAQRLAEADLALHDSGEPREAVAARLAQALPLEAPRLPRLPGGAGELADKEVLRADRAKQEAEDAAAVAKEERDAAAAKAKRLEGIAAGKQSESSGEGPQPQVEAGEDAVAEEGEEEEEEEEEEEPSEDGGQLQPAVEAEKDQEEEEEEEEGDPSPVQEDEPEVPSVPQDGPPAPSSPPLTPASSGAGAGEEQQQDQPTGDGSGAAPPSQGPTAQDAGNTDTDTGAGTQTETEPAPSTAPQSQSDPAPSSPPQVQHPEPSVIPKPVQYQFDLDQGEIDGQEPRQYGYEEVRERLNREAAERLDAREHILTGSEAGDAPEPLDGEVSEEEAAKEDLPGDESAVDSIEGAEGLSEAEKEELKQSIRAAKSLEARARKVEQEERELRAQADEAERTGEAPADAVTRFRSLRGGK